MFDSKLKKELAAERERALKSEALDHAMHDHLPMIEFTTDGYILDASPLFLHSVGYSLNEIVQQHHAMFCMKEDTDSPSYREFWRALANGHSQHGTFHPGRDYTFCEQFASVVTPKNISIRKSSLQQAHL
ncbi:PAS domain S-box protein, partial [Aeromonas caviae]|uniref:PAS domain S-box protein n=1 Tax=Aeromonas caviae TaxID=648 RepID=UPI003014A54F